MFKNWMRVRPSFKFLDGTPVGQYQRMHGQDHSVQTYEITVRSLSGVGPNDLTDLLQRKYEVVSVKEVSKDVFVR